MLWCPDCKETFRDGFSQCSDCGAPLEERPCETFSEPNGAPEFLPHAYFMTVTEEFEAGRITALLNGEGIGVIKKYCNGMSASAMGVHGQAQGIDLLVSKNVLEQAKIILEESGHCIGAEDAEEEVPASILRESMRLGVRMYLVLAAAIFLVVALGTIMTIVKSLGG